MTVRAKGKVVELFDPLDGSSRDLPEKSVGADGRTSVPLHFESLQGLFLVVRSGAAGVLECGGLTPLLRGQESAVKPAHSKALRA